MKMYSIYSLVDPRDDKPFYVGATVKPLKTRLAEHLSYKCPQKKYWSVMKKRYALIDEIIKSGMTPRIDLLEMTSIRDVNKKERYYYDTFIGMGITLLQDKRFFNYSDTKYGTYKSHKEGFKLIAIRVGNKLHKTLSARAEKERRGLATLVRMILEDSFKKAKKIGI